MKLTTTLLLLAGLVLAVTHYFSLELHLYWRYLWLDMPMHFLGGTVVALGYLALRDFFPSWPARWFSIYKTLVAVFIVAVAWEVFEVAAGIIMDDTGYVPDTIADLILGVMGGTLGYYIGTSVRRLDDHD